MEDFFLKMIMQLRQHEEVVIFGLGWNISTDEAAKVVRFLEKEYQEEAFDYPFQAPSFDEKAALWAAKIIFHSSYFLLNRQDSPKDLEAYFQLYPKSKLAGAHLSVDLCLRFLPDIILQCKMMDSEDALIDLLTDILREFHYSGVRLADSLEEVEIKPVFENPCLRQLYIDRILEYNKRVLAELPFFADSIRLIEHQTNFNLSSTNH